LKSLLIPGPVGALMLAGVLVWFAASLLYAIVTGRREMTARLLRGAAPTILLVGSLVAIAALLLALR
jgi:hypothetical protein